MRGYTISWGAPTFQRPHVTVRAPHWLAVFVGRHLWRVLGKGHGVEIIPWNIERFTSSIPTSDGDWLPGTYMVSSTNLCLWSHR